MKLLSKIFNLSLIGLSASPMAANLNTNSNVILNTSKSNIDESKLRCTITYIGKNCAKDGLPIIARTADGQALSQSHLIKYQRDQLANATIKNIYGFEYKLPSKTYAFIAGPDCPKTDKKTEGNQYLNFAFNEMGVGLSCTLSCYANPKTVLLEDPYKEDGLSEEILNQCIIPQAKTAREAMQIAANIINDHGNAEGNLIMAVDQKEAWLMEMYTGSQYCAVKLPDDKVCVAGNEFILDSLHDLGINETNFDERCIVSPNLLNFVKKHYWDKYKWDEGEQHIEDIYHLDLFNSYAQPLAEIGPGGEELSNTDYSHMRTWRGYCFFDPSGNIAQEYGFNTKYPAFFIPRDKDGNTRTDIDVYDVMNVYRDEYDDILANTQHKSYQRFKDAKDDGSLRSIATDHARSIHVMTSNPNKTKQFAVNCWYCPSAANYSPFVLLNNGMNSFDDEYSYVPERYGYDDNCASTVFRKLNALGAVDREHYGLPLQPFWQTFEKIYGKQMTQVIDDAVKLNASDATNILDNFNKHVRHVQIEAVRYVTEDLTSHIMDDLHVSQTIHTTFKPLVDLETYLTDLGWKDFRTNGSITTFKFGDTEAKLDVGEGYYKEKGTMSVAGDTTSINVRKQNNRIYVDFDTLNNVLETYKLYKVKTININDYLTKKFNHWVWIGPTIGVLILAAGIVIYFVFKKKKQQGKNNPTVTPQ